MGVRFIRKGRVARGKNAEAMAFATEVAAHWKEAYGTDITWGFEIGGDVGTMYWFADHASLADYEKEMQASMVNDDTNKLLNSSVDLFQASPQDKIIITM